MQDLALNLVTVLDQLRVSRVLALGDGAGGNIVLRCGISLSSWLIIIHHYQHKLLIRFGMCHAARVHGVILLNTQASAGGSPAKHEKAGIIKYLLKIPEYKVKDMHHLSRTAKEKKEKLDRGSKRSSLRYG